MTVTDDETTSAPNAAPSASVQVNGTVVSLAGVSGHTNALDWLRSRGLTGAKEGCAEGECGACSVLVARPGVDSATEWTAINSCLAPIAALDGAEIVTSEGLAAASTAEALHPVQQEMAERGGSQCGYCTPGFVCSMAAEFYRPGRADTSETTHECGPNGFDLHALSGNLCRCTGYRPIRDAAFALPQAGERDPMQARTKAAPPTARPTRLQSGGTEFRRATSLPDALEFLAENPTAQVVAGCTDWGVEVNLRGSRATQVLAIDSIAELREFTLADHQITLGAGLSLSEIEKLLAGRIPLLDKTFEQFASRLIRNSATLGGNLGTGSPIGDSPPSLLALEASVMLASVRGTRQVPLADYFTGYRESVRAADELIVSVQIPTPVAPIDAFHKIAKRRFDDISSVAVGFAIHIEGGLIAKARIGLGGVAATPIRALATEAALTGQSWTEETMRAAAETMADEGTPMSDHRASAEYRRAMLGQALIRLFHTEGEADR